jgi:hypothetical protein
LLLQHVLLVLGVCLALSDLLLGQTSSLERGNVCGPHLLALLGHGGHLLQSRLLALQIGLRELASLRPEGRKQLLLLTCHGSGLLGRAQEGLLLGLG